ncbi:AEC family transporter [Haladaptatus sp. R4]|uniref:AEC family transporter n=1 Tax=Haladaptatus sp. R4 TaxID=1679489 RepID=UPI000B08F632|nr:AEC family transporter [Haladaptatus sp. R4]
MSAVSAFTSAILPIIAIAGVGYVIGWRTGISVDQLNTVALNFFLPALVFHGIVTTDLSGKTVLNLGLAVFAYTLVMMGVAYLSGRTLDLPDAALPGVVLASAFPNSGFVGIPLTEFVFGDVGRTTATLFLTIQSVILYTVGVYVVSASSDNTAGVRSAVREVFRLPLVYAVVLAALVRFLGLVPPVDGTFMTTLDSVGSASVPLMLTVVGIQLAEVDLGGLHRIALPTRSNSSSRRFWGRVSRSSSGSRDRTWATSSSSNVRRPPPSLRSPSPSPTATTTGSRSRPPST